MDLANDYLVGVSGIARPMMFGGPFILGHSRNVGRQQVWAIQRLSGDIKLPLVAPQIECNGKCPWAVWGTSWSPGNFSDSKPGFSPPKSGPDCQDTRYNPTVGIDVLTPKLPKFLQLLIHVLPWFFNSSPVASCFFSWVGKSNPLRHLHRVLPSWLIGTCRPSGWPFLMWRLWFATLLSFIQICTLTSWCLEGSELRSWGYPNPRTIIGSDLELPKGFEAHLSWADGIFLGGIFFWGKSMVDSKIIEIIIRNIRMDYINVIKYHEVFITYHVWSWDENWIIIILNYHNNSWIVIGC